ncbi:hypothetical protein AU468_05260 [Alkalispirochaeta sphaeroplastigenens]|uniref:Uncharacterized protein n=1 Tax=Alkalispirochaeta sphaeroplastigenens TaxID=1187066 RepID=A0A2S4JVQ4_9SPIO|nr:hypothetical protein AU468_05260 [Alkalispirochaeta sphaeroplastigenens]
MQYRQAKIMTKADKNIPCQPGIIITKRRLLAGIALGKIIVVGTDGIRSNKLSFAYYVIAAWIYITYVKSKKNHTLQFDFQSV